MKKTNIVVIAIIVVLLIILGLFAYFSYTKKSPDGGACRSTKNCESGFSCVNKKCSSGKKGSACNSKNNCKTSFCVKNLCMDGEEGDTCVTYKDCKENMICKNTVCQGMPDYSRYFDKVTISKIKPGIPPGIENPPVETTIFTLNDAIEIDLLVKEGTIGNLYAEVNETTGGLVFRNETQEINQPGDRGTGFALPTNTKPGEYVLNIYFNNEIIYSVPITVK